ncbi:MAG: PD-(D/E)XK nuclease family protein [Actinobacteria bacterium]|nr:MAG: PD-(D/E)XK nuclease family protein [Actinomycetota bacterium]
MSDVESSELSSLNAAQRDVVDQLGARRGGRPQFDAELRHELLGQLEARLGPILSDLEPETTFFVSKRKLSMAHGCEARFLAKDSFEWSVPVARGIVTHKAIETSIHWRRELTPLVLVDESIARLEEGTDDFARWLQGCREIERAELRAEANEQLTKFFECWPRLSPRWRPVVESRVRYDLFNERVTLQGRVDLQLGQPEGTTAGKVLVDFKTGRFSPMHLEDLRFYSLIETLRIGTPPRRVASYYLDQGRFVPEDVSVAQLETTVRRVVAGIEKMVTLESHEREPIKITGPACRWCPLFVECPEGQSAMAATDIDDTGPLDDLESRSTIQRGATRSTSCSTTSWW